jgi:UDP-2,3-diacylglucosamine pyrophosphatase LpxH
MEMQMMELVYSFIERGWEGLMTIYVVTQIFKARKAKKNGHNPSPEYHELHNDVEKVWMAIRSLGERVAFLEGKHDKDKD